MIDPEVFSIISSAIAKHFDVDPSRVTEATTSEDIDGWDSVSYTILLLSIEDALLITLPVDRAWQLANVGELAQLATAVRSGTIRP